MGKHMRKTCWRRTSKNASKSNLTFPIATINKLKISNLHKSLVVVTTSILTSFNNFKFLYKNLCGYYKSLF